MDQEAKVLLEFVFQQAISSAKSKMVKSMLKNVIDISNGDDLKVIVEFIEKTENKEKINEEKIKLLKERIETLNSFQRIGSILKKELKAQYELIKKKRPLKKVEKRIKIVSF